MDHPGHNDDGAAATAQAPGLHLFTSNRLETLADRLARVLGVPLPSPFTPEVIVVRNKGMERWLRLELARAHGISAQQRFPFPETFGHELFRALQPGLPPQAPLDRETLVWRIYEALPRLIQAPGFEPLADYLEAREADRTTGNATAADSRKQMQLATRIANLFDQYLVFRPEMMLGWDRSTEDADADPAVAWQARLWREISAGQSTVHAASLWRHFRATLEQGRPAAAPFPARLSIFGVSALPPFYLDLFAALGRHLPVHLFLLQPSQEYWGDIVSPREGDRLLRRQVAEGLGAFEAHLEQGNRLLASLGYLGRDFLKLVLDAGDWWTDEAFEDPGTDTVLRAIQSDLLHLRDRGLDPEHPPLTIHAGDDSIRVHSCHSPLREMEVLHDQLLECFRRDPTLAPRDIVVMTPDIEAYAPFIQAVFGSPEDPALAIPFSVADRGARGQSHAVETFLEVLGLPATRLGAPAVLALLETAPLRRRFGFEERDLPRLREWVEATHIRWGRDAAHRATLGLPPLPGHTWKHGLDRLLLGAGMKGGDDQLFAGILPFEPMEGDDAALLGRFAAFLRELFEILDELAGDARPLRDWANWLTRLVDRLFVADDDGQVELQVLRNAADTLRRQQEWSGFTTPLPLNALLERLGPMLEEDPSGAGYLNGGVTFCGLKPMRSIPFRIVCLVGMNDAAFPRTNRHLSFDLMARRPRLGDRSMREDDRYLFLETLLSARDKLILSHVGQSIRDNKESPPSVVVSELLDYIDQAFRPADPAPGPQPSMPPARARSTIIQHHRLQAFHPDYFGDEPGWFSFSAQNCLAGQRTRVARHPATRFVPTPTASPATGLPAATPAPPELRVITLEELIRDMANPARRFLRQRLGIQLEERAEGLAESEDFELGGLELFDLKQELLRDALGLNEAPGAPPPEPRPSGLDSRTLDRSRRFHHALGDLPLGAGGEFAFRSAASRVSDLLAKATTQLPGLRILEPDKFLLEVTPTSLPVPVPVTLSVTIGLRCPRGPVLVRPAKLKAGILIAGWLTHLAASQHEPGIETAVLTEEGLTRFAPVSEPAPLLRTWVSRCLEVADKPLPFFPRSSLAYAKEFRSGAGKPPAERHAAALAKAQAEWEGNDFSKSQPESADRHFELCFRGADPLSGDFAALARELLAPMLDARIDPEDSP